MYGNVKEEKRKNKNPKCLIIVCASGYNAVYHCYTALYPEAQTIISHLGFFFFGIPI